MAGPATLQTRSQAHFRVGLADCYGDLMSIGKGRKEKRREGLIRKRDRLQTLLPLLSPEKAQDARYELQKLDAELGPEKPGFAKPQPDLSASAAGVNGVGGLMFQTKAPPGAGRIIRVPLYLYDANFTQLSFQAPEIGPMIFTSNGANRVSEENPTVGVTMPNDISGRRVISGLLFRSPVIEWAKLRIVGLETAQIQAVYGGQASGNQISGPSPLPDSAVAVDGYDVGPGSGETGRYDPYSLTLVPPPIIGLNPFGPNPFLNPVPGLQSPIPIGFPTQTLNFGVLTVGQTSSLQFTFAMAPLSGTRNFSSKLTTAPSSFSDDMPNAPFAGWLPANPAVRTVTIVFSPTSAGIFSGIYSIVIDDGGGNTATFRVSVIGAATDNRYYNNGKLYLLLKNLNVGGGANLLSQEGYVDGALYDARLDYHPGLRALPELLSPNRAFIEAAIVGPQLTTMTFSIHLLCDILEDKEYGDYISGPYAREASLLRSDVINPNSGVR